MSIFLNFSVFHSRCLPAASATDTVQTGLQQEVQDQEHYSNNVQVVVLNETHVVIKRDFPLDAEQVQVIDPVFQIHLRGGLLLNQVMIESHLFLAPALLELFHTLGSVKLFSDMVLAQLMASVPLGRHML